MADQKLAKKIIDLRESIDMSQTDLAKRLGIDKSAMSKIENGTRNVSNSELKSIARIFSVSTDYLLNIEKKQHYYDLTEKDERDVQKQLTNMMDGLDPDSSLAFFSDGSELNEEDKRLIRASMEQTLRLTKEIAKKKFTPKKYRHEDD